ncbi:MAG: hypothetical protein IPM45_18010 [Acidimicrobiales bacterium]|nr:hypothetical protein [Acidimicrobiales bacterium]
MVASAEDPTLTSAEVDDLLELARRPDRAGNSPLNVDGAAAWQAATVYTAGTVVKTSGRWWQCAVAGTSAATAPSWPDLAGQPVTGRAVDDGGVVWVDNGGPWAATWALDAAAAEGWRWKASKVSPRFGFSTGDQRFDRGDVFAHCLQMAAVHQRRAAGSTVTPAGG